MSVAAIPRRGQPKRWRSLSWPLIAILATGVAAISARYLWMPVRQANGGDSSFHFAEFAARLLPHVLGGVLALFVGPWQFVTKLRRRFPRVHRWMGYVYFAAVALGSIAGFLMALVSMGGMPTHLGFGLLAVLWLGSAIIALRAALHRDFATHRRWMIRNYALTFAAVTLRIELPLLMMAHLPFATAYMIVSWSSWVPNGIVAEMMLLSSRPNRASVPA